MRRGTREYEEYMVGVRERASKELAAAYRSFTIAALRHDWRCNISPESREILRIEFLRRGIMPAANDPAAGEAEG